ncbi:MAG: divalent-cation tolerance protein CutA [Xanthomonadales bacterium]|nr:divalent-cation tolerance protein CutA [Xanthomonadales bacterium]
MPTSPNAVVALCTCPPSVAESLARSLVDRRAAACVNILPAVQSIYRWKDQVESEQEALLIIKSTRDRWTLLTELVQQNHPYEVPELIRLPVDAGLDPYLDWISQATEV